MKKIVITGGLGYIGTELCKIYSGYSWNDKITVIDNRFISERVNQIRNWNMDFVHGDILDKELIKKYCSNADIVHHLAGITDVPRVKSQSNEEHDKKIKEIAEEGTQNILDVIEVTEETLKEVAPKEVAPKEVAPKEVAPKEEKPKAKESKPKSNEILENE